MATQHYGVSAAPAEGRTIHDKFVPTVFIGLGGSGKDVLMRLRKRFQDRYPADGGDRFKQFARFLFIDTDQREFVPSGQPWAAFVDVQPENDEMVRCVITSNRFRQIFDDLKANVHCAHLSWLKPGLSVLGSTVVENGAGTHRQLGRLAFFENYEAIRAAVKRQLGEVLAYARAHGAEAYDDQIEVVIVTSVAGGTGAGMFIDVAYLVRDILSEANYQNLPKQHISVVGFLPALWEQDQPQLYPRMQQNAYASLLELEYYGTPRTGDELFLGHALHRNQTGGAGFRVQWEPGRKDRYLNGPGWSTFFLVDNINNLAMAAPLPREEIFQMTADYLFLDFEQYRFAEQKRSNRSNLVQFKDRFKATWIARDEGRSNNDTGAGNIFASQNGCMYSTFGVAEIFFDVQKLYQAAGYRLAMHLVTHRWLGEPERFGDEMVKDWARSDLREAKARPGQDPPPSFHQESLIAAGLRSAAEDWKKVLAHDFEGLATMDDPESAAEMARLIREHQALLGSGGKVRRTLEANLNTMVGSPQVLGPLRERLHDLILWHISEHGVTAAARLIPVYREALDGVFKALSAFPGGEVTMALLSRVIEAGLVPFPGQRIALHIEVERARSQVLLVLNAAYNRAAATALAPAITSAIRYLGDPADPKAPDHAIHGRLHDYVAKAAGHLGEIAKRLQVRYANAARNADVSLRRQSLTPPWNDDGYDTAIDAALVINQNVGRGSRKEHGFEFDWKRLERCVLAELHKTESVGPAGSLSDLIVYWFDFHQTTEPAIDRATQILAEACETVLRQNDGLRHDPDLLGGNATDLLFALKPGERQGKLRNLLSAAAPYFPTTVARAAGDLPPKHASLFGLLKGGLPTSEEAAGEITAEVRGLVLAMEPGATWAIGNPLEAHQQSILLVREMAGFPLEDCARLDSMHDAYRNTQTPTNSHDVCHIDYQEAWEDLPDIRRVGNNIYSQIRESIDLVLLGMMTRTVVWRQGAFYSDVPRQNGIGVVAHRLSKRISRAIKSACDQDDIRDSLESRWALWQTHATVKHWACLFASALRTCLEANEEVEVEKGKRVAVPLRNCFSDLSVMIGERLRKMEGGAAWYEAIKPPGLDPFGEVRARGPEPTGLDDALARINDDLPIYQIVPSKVDAIALLNDANATSST